MESGDARAVFHEVLSPAAFFLAYLDEASELLELASRGIASLVKQPALTEALVNLAEYRAGGPDPLRDEKLQTANRLAELATREIEHDFPLLHAQTLVGIWGALEAWIEDLCWLWIARCPGRCEWNGRLIKVEVVDLLAGSIEQRAQTVLSSLKAERRAQDRVGVAQFESVLTRLGLGGHVPREYATALFRMQQTRHVYAHRGGMADETFVVRCGDFGDVAQGERVFVTRGDLELFMAAAIAYTHILHLRVEEVLLGHADWPAEFTAHADASA